MKRPLPHARLLLAAGCLLALSAVALFDPAVRAQAQAGSSRAEQFKQMSVRSETTGLAEPFLGITANGKVEPGLFALTSTGVSTSGVRTAAAAFLDALDASQRSKTVFPVADDEWRKWMNPHTSTCARA